MTGAGNTHMRTKKTEEKRIFVKGVPKFSKNVKGYKRMTLIKSFPTTFLKHDLVFALLT